MRLPELSLERELLRLLGTGRNARIAARCIGFDGRGGESFQRVGKSFGLTRERIRQIVGAASAQLRTGQAANRVHCLWRMLVGQPRTGPRCVHLSI